MEETRAWWNETSGYFQEEYEIPVGVHYGPGTPDDDGLGLLGDVAGDDVVELGCGGGQCSVGLARRGAASVTGVDLSSAQLDFAADLVAERGVSVDLVEGDVTALPLADDCADLAFSAYAFQWVDDLTACFAEAARILRDDGRFVFSLPHPFYNVFDPESGDRFRSYFDTGELRYDHDGLDATEVLYRRRVSDVHAALREAGFVVDRMLEPGSADAADYDDVGKFHGELMSDVPATLVVRAIQEQSI
jgi:SAM-dependent methyltransferase